MKAFNLCWPPAVHFGRVCSTFWFEHIKMLFFTAQCWHKASGVKSRHLCCKARVLHLQWWTMKDTVLKFSNARVWLRFMRSTWVSRARESLKRSPEAMLAFAEGLMCSPPLHHKPSVFYMQSYMIYNLQTHNPSGSDVLCLDVFINVYKHEYFLKTLRLVLCCDDCWYTLRGVG